MTGCSGGHLNPAVTLGVFIAGGINVLVFFLYVVSQLLGGIIGALFIMVSSIISIAILYVIVILLRMAGKY